MHWERRREERGKLPTGHWEKIGRRPQAQLHEFGKTAELCGLAEHV